VNLLPLQQGIIYGPIHSRRLGRSLGINLMPHDYKLCSFNCVYCHYGPTTVHEKSVAHYVKDLPDPLSVSNALEDALTSDEQFDYVTFSGNGEPTMYPHFAQVVDELVRLRDKHRPHLKIALLSNSSGLGSEAVRRSLIHIDVPVFKLDAGSPRTFAAINRPTPGIGFDEICECLESLSGIYIQTLLVQGTPSNTERHQLESYFARIRKIRPRAVHVYSIDRPVPNAELIRVQPDELQKIARWGAMATDVDFQAFYMA
jgi:wyosine [tRNA(Phe)-imidazoG37] synthetase (radical SAM superfamily)